MDTAAFILSGLAVLTAAVGLYVAERARRAAERSAQAAEETARANALLVEVERQRDLVTSRPLLHAEPHETADDRGFIWVSNTGSMTIDEITLHPTSSTPALRFEGDVDQTDLPALGPGDRHRVYFHNVRHVRKYNPLRLHAHCRSGGDEWDQALEFDPPTPGPFAFR